MLINSFLSPVLRTSTIYRLAEKALLLRADVDIAEVWQNAPKQLRQSLPTPMTSIAHPIIMAGDAGTKRKIDAGDKGKKKSNASAEVIQVSGITKPHFSAPVIGTSS